MTFENLPPEKSYFTRASGSGLGETMPMWRVQTEGYKDKKGMLIGVVSPSKVLDASPDGEYISAGLNTKGCDSVALGRQGNFFHWGFAASPTYMTDEAKLVFVNAIHYISQFDGQRAFVKNKSYVTRASVDDILYTISDEGFARWQAMLGEARTAMEKRREELRQRKEDGEELTTFEESMLKSPPLKEYTRLELMHGVPDKLKKEFGKDWDQYASYYNENRDYLYAPPTEGRSYALEVDEDARALGIANDDLRLLEKCIDLLESQEDQERALRLLQRYTNEEFKSAAEWRDWLKKYRERLFFSESSGFKFLIDVNRAAADSVAEETRQRR